MIAEMENLVAVDESEHAENLVAADESDPLAMIAEMENLVAVDEGQNGSIENSDIDDVYQAFSDQVNSK